MAIVSLPTSNALDVCTFPSHRFNNLSVAMSEHLDAVAVDQLAVNTIRTLSMDAVQKANSGHPGMPMGMADAAYILWTKHLRHNPSNPDWFGRDRFILSAGHGCMLLYSLLHLCGYDVSLDDIKNFRQWDSMTPGHPEYGHTPGVEVTTGPLGQGFATGVGMAMAEAYLAETYNQPEHKVVDHRIYAIVSDGDLMEGVSYEAASLAGHLKLGKLVYLYDDNSISIDGGTDLSFSDEVKGRFEAMGWHYQVVDGHDRDAVDAAITAAKNDTQRPSLIACKTHIGFGSPNKQDSASSHGAPLGDEEIRKTKEFYGWDPEAQFLVPEEVKTNLAHLKEYGNQYEAEWNQAVDVYTSLYPQEAEGFKAAISGELPAGWEGTLPVFETDAKGLATRKASGAVLNAIAEVVPHMIGGSADLTGSVNTLLKGRAVYSPENYGGQNVHYGVREHAMGAAMNGMALHGGVIPYAGTFLVFSDYCKPAIRLGGLMGVSPVYVFTHDSIGLGEDGPTHQPIEHLISMRSIPNVTVIRPGDANEVSQAWKSALTHKGGPVLVVLTRQNLPILDRSVVESAAGASKGAYVLIHSEKETPDVILMASGSELQHVVEARTKLAEEGIDARVVSFPSWELFEEQPDDYKAAVLPSNVKARVSIEAGSTLGWHRFVGDGGKTIGIDRFGASAPYQTLMEKFGFTADNVVKVAKEVVAKTV